MEMPVNMCEKKVLIISHVIPIPHTAANEIKIYRMLEWIKYRGWEIILLFNTDYLDAERRSVIEEKFGKVYLRSEFLLNNSSKIGLFDKIFKIFSRRRNLQNAKEWLSSPQLKIAVELLYEKYKPEIILSEYMFSSPCLKNIPNSVLKIIDTHDMFSRRWNYLRDYGIKEDTRCTPKEERNYLLNCDLIIAVQKKEAELFKKLVPERTVITVTVDHPVSENRISNKNSQNNSLLIVASDNIANLYGVNNFIKNVWPRVVAKNSNCKLVIVGKVGERLNTFQPSIIIKKWVQNLDIEYQNSTIVINPVSIGTGLKNKSVEALCQGKLLITTPNGAEGITDDKPENMPFLVAETNEHFSELILLALESDSLRKMYEERAFTFAKTYFSTEYVYKELERYFF